MKIASNPILILAALALAMIACGPPRGFVDEQPRGDATTSDMGPTTCGGEGRCTTCACEVVEGSAMLEPMGRTERKTLAEERGESVLRMPIRLACQARFKAGIPGVVIVRKHGVRPPA